MPTWPEIRAQLEKQPWLVKAGGLLKQTGKASESPAGFAITAAIGLSIVLYINIPAATHSTPAAPASLAAPVGSSNTAADNKDASTDTSLLEAVETPATKPASMETFRLKRRETLIGLLRRASISNSNAHKAVASLKEVTNLRKLKAGQLIQLKRQKAGGNKVAELRIRDTFAEEAVVALASHPENGSYYKADRQTIRTYALQHFIEGTITDSLYLSAQRQGMPAQVIVDLIRLLSFDVDFEREIRTGDHFEVYFARSYSPQFNDVENGRILKAKLTLRKRELDAYYFREEDGSDGYFDSTGKSTRRALMKTPLDVAVITSSYGRRKHPVLGYTRMHKGADFRAPTGTPIMAAGDGIIEMSARNGSYGNYIRIRHNSTYKTSYAHLSRYGKGVKKGRRVKQGQIIGYSGSTGRVTAAHLHYEVLVNGKQTNPMTLKLPSGKTLKGKELQRFHQQTEQLSADLMQVQLVHSTRLEPDGKQGSADLADR
ncbi:MAG: peptidoglycan DD-metalloendopeptidase family protein [Kordiimonadaceae bacterium]|nr:peptidoglycan DD-metalloendopeptidase family protein [Kordiimonadaceae bacterium]